MWLGAGSEFSQQKKVILAAVGSSCIDVFAYIVTLKDWFL